MLRWFYAFEFQCSYICFQERFVSIHEDCVNLLFRQPFYEFLHLFYELVCHLQMFVHLFPNVFHLLVFSMLYLFCEIVYFLCYICVFWVKKFFVYKMEPKLFWYILFSGRYLSYKHQWCLACSCHGLFHEMSSALHPVFCHL